MIDRLWKLNGEALDVLGLCEPKLTYGNFAPDTLVVTHATAEWDAEPLFAYGEMVALTREAVTVFRGKRRKAPRFAGAEAESLSYEFEGPWGWLARCNLLQNAAVVVNPAASLVPILVPQGLVILGQSDAGTTVNLGQALLTVLQAAVDADVPITIGEITGFNFPVAWDEMADLKVADAIVRLLQVAPDAVVKWDYATENPTISIVRRGGLTAANLLVAPKGKGGEEDYVEFESIQLTDRPDLQITSVHLTYRRINSVNGDQFLKLETENAGGGAPTDEGAFVRTITLAGSAETVLLQQVKVRALSAYLTQAGTITSASNAAAFAALSAFWKLKEGWLAEAGTTIKAFRATGRRVTDPDQVLDAALNSEVVEGFITPWMEETTLNRKGQDQTFTAEVLVDKTINGVVTEDRALLTAGVMASNCDTKTYSWAESESYLAPEPKPEGLAASLLTALGTLMHDGTFTLAQEECDLSVRPGHAINLAGGRAEWTAMGAPVQTVTADLESGKTGITVGWPRALGPDDLIDVMRANRFKTRGATVPMMRTSGKF